MAARRWIALLAAVLALLSPRGAAAQDAPVMRGRVISAGEGPVHGLRVRVRSGLFADSAEVRADGGFEVAVGPLAGRDSVELLVDAADAARRVFHPALVRVPVSELEREREIVLVPRVWTIVAGRYAGERVEIRLDDAFGEGSEGRHGAFYRWAAGTGPRALAGWPGVRFPLRVAFDREWSGEPITQRDSVAFWEAVGGLELAFGEDLFRPAAFADAAPRENGGPDDAILVWVDPALRNFTGYGSAISTRGDITYGDLRLRRGALRDYASTGLVVHELLHTLGFGHTCAWRSVLADVRRCPSRRAEEPTPEDVAYVQLASRVRDLERVDEARHGLAAALAGDRALRERERGMDLSTMPSPSIPLLDPVSAPVQADSVSAVPGR